MQYQELSLECKTWTCCCNNQALYSECIGWCHSNTQRSFRYNSSQSLTEGSYGKAITVGVALILQYVSVFSHKQLGHYLNITMRNVVKVFYKDTIPGNGTSVGGSGSVGGTTDLPANGGHLIQEHVCKVIS